MADASKTEQATPRRRQKAREKGQVVRSRELISSLGLTGAVLLFSAMAGSFLLQWRGLLREELGHAVGSGTNPGTLITSTAIPEAARTLAVVVCLSWMAAMVGAVAQGGIVFAPSALQPNWGRINPATRAGQLFSLPSFGRLLKSLLPGSAIVCLAANIVYRDWLHISHLPHIETRSLIAFSLQRLFEIAWKSALVLLLWSGVDYLIERQKHESDLRMSRQDLMDEYKETEGHPTVKGRIRRLRRQILRRRMLEDTKKASVVITNPNEFAVALEYRLEMAAPVVVAKGRNLFALQIKEVARWHGIPMVENPPLAHALYRAVEVGQSIPPKLYAVVAAILAAIYRAQKAVNVTREAR